MDIIVQFRDRSKGGPTFWDWDFGDNSEHSYERNPLHSYAHSGEYHVTLISGNNDHRDSVTVKITLTSIPRFFTFEPYNTDTADPAILYGSPDLIEWSVIAVPAGSERILLKNGTLLAVGYSGDTYYSTDAGKTWTLSIFPTYTPFEHDPIDLNSGIVRGSDIDVINNNFWIGLYIEGDYSAFTIYSSDGINWGVQIVPELAGVSPTYKFFSFKGTSEVQPRWRFISSVEVSANVFTNYLFTWLSDYGYWQKDDITGIAPCGYGGLGVLRDQTLAVSDTYIIAIDANEYAYYTSNGTEWTYLSTETYGGGGISVFHIEDKFYLNFTDYSYANGFYVIDDSDISIFNVVYSDYFIPGQPIKISDTYYAILEMIYKGRTYPVQPTYDNLIRHGTVITEPWTWTSDSTGIPVGVGLRQLVTTPDPHADFTWSFIDYTSANFINLSLHGSSWDWTFGDGSYSTAMNPVHSFPSFLTDYSVTLTTSNINGADSITKTVITSIMPNPVADFTWAFADPVTANFSDLSLNTPASWDWTFGDGSYSTSQNPSHVYADYDTDYTVALIVSNIAGSDSTTATIHTSSFLEVTMVAGYGATEGLTPEAAYSSNGIDWTQNRTFSGDSSYTNLSAYGLACNSGTFWVMGGSLNNVNSLLYSIDGITFNSCNDSNLLRYANSIATNDDIWVAVGYSNSEINSSIVYSYNGIDWTSSDFLFPPSGMSQGYDEFIRVVWNGTAFLAGGYAGYSSNNLAFSYNGVDWTNITDPLGPSFAGYSINAISWDGSKWMIATGDNGVISTSTDGINWSPVIPVGLSIDAPISIANNGTRWVVVGNGYGGNPDTLAYSDDDGSHWTSLGQSMISEGGYYPQVVYNGENFILSNQDGGENTLAYSADGSSWTGLGHDICEWWNQALAVGRIVVPPPNAPVLTDAIPGDGIVDLTWLPVSEANTYNLYYSDGDAVIKIAHVTSPYSVTGLVNDTEYSFTVSAVNEVGESEMSNILTATPVAPAPVLDSVTPGDNRLTIAWLPVVGATSYNIYWKQGATVTKLDGTKITSATSPYLKKRLVDGTEYAFGVTAVGITGESLLSNVITGTPVDATYLLQGWWKGEDDTVDSVNGNNGIWIANEAYDVGAVGDCFKFGAATGILEIPNSVKINFNETDRFTIMEKLKFVPGDWGWTSNFHQIQKVIALNEYPITGFTIAIYEWYRWVRVAVQTNAPGLPAQYWEFNKVVDGEPACINPFNTDPTVYDFYTWQDIKFTYDDGRWEFYVNGIKQTPNSEYYNCQLVANNSDYYLSTYNVSNTEAILVDEFKIARGIE